ncbi:lysine transporter LysE [Rhodobacter veldkampii DSM 11550]|uniref:Lysine transporter LysE n=1 Tax=Phaeovulum veldkampii DSM 11550 TaxID=1185920 RepID=A0A2T4JK26_9RHOB|nr:LysE family translocator [Phaeovulum veldkampii]MBK5945044.1 lysine transporter LysE [Phaeovulum veldkampii DSM 11550]PTE18117.1 lysine transporter LysE [Phaeovulum veldkampii DSM 11550]TDQ57072.1 threonine/homoserine/homoserine lactone efflux protein [Phaeovulum veldkampii DSM 11550]
MSLELWGVFLLASIALSLTPGPNALLVLDHGARYGLRRAGFTALGSVLAMLAMVAASLAGLGALMLASETLFAAVKWLGAAYLVWLGLRLWRAPGFAGGQMPDHAARPITRRRAFVQGAAVMLSNPKTLLFFTTFLPQFLRPDAPLLAQFIVLGLTLALVELGVELVLAGAAGRLAPSLVRHGRIFNRITGGAFVGIGAMVAASGRASA